MEQLQILCVLPANEAQKAKMMEAAPSATFEFIPIKDVIAENVKRADVIIGNVNTSLLKEASGLKWLQLFSAGFDAYAVPGLLPENVVLTNAVGAYGLTVSEHVLTMLMSLNRKFPEYYRNQRERLWRPAGMVKSVNGSTILVLGTGDIGGQFARKAKALGAYIIGVRRSKADKPDFIDEQYTLDELDTALPRADSVVICLPLSQQTYHLFDARRLAVMKDGATLINIGRGGIVDTDALADALESGKIGAAGIDVTEPEPLPSEHRLWLHENVLITPHIAGDFYLPSTLDRIVNIASENLKRFIAGEELFNIVGTR